MAEIDQVIPRVGPEAQAVVKPLSHAEREALTESIQLEGVHTPTVILPDGRIIDGHNRWEISGGKAPFEVCDVSEERALRLVCDLNEIRRQYSPAEWKAQRENRMKDAKALRRKGKTQDEVSKILGVPLGTIAFWETKESGNIIGSNNVSPPDQLELPDLRVTIPREVRSQIAERVEKESTAQVAADLHVTVKQVEQIETQGEGRNRKTKPPLSETSFVKGRYAASAEGLAEIEHSANVIRKRLDCA